MAEKFEFVQGHYNKPRFRKSFNAFVAEIFGGLDFGPWNDLGYDFREYTPFSYVQDGRVVANVSASPMNLVVQGRPVRALQIGTVATLAEYRGRGLIRRLMDKVHAYWKAHTGPFYLFANEDASKFYPQFGYRRLIESSFHAEPPIFQPSKHKVRKLDLNAAFDREFLRKLAKDRAPVSNRLGVVDHAWLLLFHAATAYRRDVLFIDSLNVAVIYRRDQTRLRLVDVIGPQIPTLEKLFPFLGSPDIETIEFGFTPDRLDIECLKVKASEASLLFVLGPLEMQGQVFCFPLTSQA